MKRRISIWWLLLILGFVIIAGGCGGGGGSGSSGTNPVGTLTEEDLLEAQDILNNALVMFDDNIEVTAERFFDSYVSELRKYPEVESVVVEKNEFIFNSFIKVNFKKGFSCSITFTSDEYEKLLYEDPPSTPLSANALPESDKVFSPLATVSSAADVKAFIGSNFNQFADTSWYDASRNSFSISTPEQLAGIASLDNRGIDFSGKTITLANDIYLVGKKWTPIGTNESFQGTFNGLGRTISNMTITANIEYTGLFALIGSNAVIENVNLANVNISSYSSGSGGIAGGNNGTITNCKSSGNVSNISDIIEPTRM